MFVQDMFVQYLLVQHMFVGLVFVEPGAPGLPGEEVLRWLQS